MSLERDFEQVARVPVEKTDSKFGTIGFPWGDAALHVYREHCKTEPEKVEVMQEVMKELMELSVENVKMYEDADGTKFPYTFISVGDLAKRVRQKEGFSPVEVTPAQAEKKVPARRRFEFVVSSFLDQAHGNAFGHCEQVIHESMMRLPAALRGDALEDTVLCMLGSPTNEMGVVGDSFTEGVQQQPFKAFGNMYARFIKKEVLQNKQPSHEVDIVLTGFSMGASFAAEAAQSLLKEGVVTQEHDNRALPHVTVNMYHPTNEHESLLRALQIPAGFAIEGIQVRNDPAHSLITSNESAFNARLKEEFAKKEIFPPTDKKQEELKHKILWGWRGVVKSLVLGGSLLGPKLKANKISGLKDKVTTSRKRRSEAEQQKKKVVVSSEGEEVSARKTLGAHSLKRGNELRRESFVNMSHATPFFRKSEWRRWDALVDEIRRLRQVQ